jgi:hypothetical protein
VAVEQQWLWARRASVRVWPWAIRLAVLVSVGTTVAADIAAGAAAGHVLTLGLVALAVAVMRVRTTGHRRGLWSFVSAGLVAQPAFHAAADLARHVAPIGSHDHLSAATSGVTAVVQVVVAAAVVVTVCLVERVVELALSEIAAHLLTADLAPAIHPEVVDRLRPRSADEPPPLASRPCVGAIARRGPPVGAPAA